MANKKHPIDKEYLINSFKAFENKILDKKYSLKLSNKSVLDKLSESEDGVLLFNGDNISSGEKGDDGKSAYDIAVENGFTGSEQEYLNSLKGAKGDDGRSIKSITKDNSNNIIVTFTDDTAQNIGQLNIDIQADFLTEGGFGNLRYYNGEFQYFNTDTETWVDTIATPDNILVVNMIPNPMQHIVGVYDYDCGHYMLKWTEPKDTVVDGQIICAVEKVIIRRKLGSVPQNENDGDLVKVVHRRDFGNQANYWYVDIDSNPSMGDEYYYKAFPISTAGFTNTSSQNETGCILAKDYYLYGFKIDQNESDPMSMISYIEDNTKFRSSYMNYEQDRFYYGDWEDSWFIQGIKPCMLNYDGTVAYELDKNNYTKKLDGTDSDVANEDFAGNAMIGIPKVYWKIVDNKDNTANIYFSNKKLDDKFVCWSHIDNNGNEIPYCFMPAYDGSLIDDKLRSLSGKDPIGNEYTEYDIKYAKANNLTDDVIWYTEVFCDRTLINLLLLLVGKSTDTQITFGSGNNNTYISNKNHGMVETGTMNQKGLFCGNTDNQTGVKVFGMEHYWGNQARRIAGWVNRSRMQVIKMTYGQSDGSSVDGYNMDGTGYIKIPNGELYGDEGYISCMLFNENGLIPINGNGSATTYYTDTMIFDNTSGTVYYALVGGDSGDGDKVGAFFAYLHYENYDYGSTVGASISCKPLKGDET